MLHYCGFQNLINDLQSVVGIFYSWGIMSEIYQKTSKLLLIWCFYLINKGLRSLFL